MKRTEQKDRKRKKKKRKEREAFIEGRLSSD